MNIVEKNLSGTAENKFSNGVSNDDAKKALELLLKWIGENPDRDGPKGLLGNLADRALSLF